MSSTHRHLLLDVFWQVISGPPCIIIRIRWKCWVTPRLRINLQRTSLEISNWKESLVITHQLLVSRKQALRKKICIDLVYDMVLTDQRVTVSFIAERLWYCGTLGTTNVNGASEMSPLR
jgi:hypothetical protein